MSTHLDNLDTEQPKPRRWPWILLAIGLWMAAIALAALGGVKVYG